MNKVPRIVITTGEPAGIGPDICLSLEGQFPDHELVLIADPKLLQQRAQQLGLQWPASLSTRSDRDRRKRCRTTYHPAEHSNCWPAKSGQCSIRTRHAQPRN